MDVLEPSEEVVILIFLVIVHFDGIVIELSEHVDVSEGEMVAHKEGSGFEVLL